MKTTHTAALSIAAIATTALADFRIGAIEPSDPTWDRPTETGQMDMGPCNLSLNDSPNDGVSYDIYYIRSSSSAPLDVTVLSHELSPIDFDPMIVVYCGVVDVDQPMTNVDAIDDDSAGYPNAFLFGTSTINPGEVYSVVVSSYSNYPQSQYGNYEINLGPNLYFSTACQADFNDDGLLDFFDISRFLINLNAMHPSADLNNDGNFDFNDVSAFLNLIDAGCP